MDNDKIKQTIEHFKARGENVRVRDIAFTLLSKMFSDPKTAYQCLFNGEADAYEEYVSDDIRGKLEDYLTEEGLIRTLSVDSDTGGLSFEENKAEMERMLVDIKIDMDNGIIDRKDGYARMESIRTKLNDKFKVERQQKERQIIVEKKFDFVCPHTRRECYQLDKEEAMKRWNLVEKKD